MEENLMAGAAQGIANYLEEEEGPDPETLPTVTGWNILIRQAEQKKQTESGIILAPAFKNDVQYLTNVGRVVAMGECCYKDKERWGEPWCKVGDWVVMPRFCGSKVKYQGVTFTLIDHREVLMVVDNPEDIDPMFNLSGQSV